MDGLSPGELLEELESAIGDYNNFIGAEHVVKNQGNGHQGVADYAVSCSNYDVHFFSTGDR